MNLKQEIHQLNNRLSVVKRKLQAAHERNDQLIIDQFNEEVAALTKRIQNVKKTSTRQLSKKGQEIKNLPFNRALTKAEQADMGALKKKVRGLVVVHPMTAIGREMGIEVMTGFAPKQF
ncbi:YibL family ribosome-associated protein [Ferrimonas lipolytica]|uniref:YibL family ribosome-associated protein n=1 Tax=Ferrimonas lipolytica TaxID=2724191 RepID=A0A6H1UAH8_9GAMM|nr:YibL family ribosome-associated protein [Ferrimonas lipolytica]QIZ76065.1 YibL family ribosome-associated protein [Ferrimonas lipolytica]